ncbi:MAG: hypothetical protein SFU27_08285 [Thermonemataceae bacterium]|nr:hypothetical protein [Thermonemataceae bacterium]
MNSYTEYPSSVLPQEIQTQLEKIEEVNGEWEILYLCKICKEKIIIRLEDYHHFRHVTTKIPCEL